MTGHEHDEGERPECERAKTYFVEGPDLSGLSPRVALKVN